MNLLGLLKRFDENAFLFLNGLHAEWLDPIMYAMTTVWFWSPLFLLVIVLLWRKAHSLKVMTIYTMAIVAAVAVADLTSTRVFKQQVKRYRPTHNTLIGDSVHTVTKPDGSEYRGGTYGFVSSHAANFFAIATTAFILLGKSRLHAWLFIWASLVSYTRIYLGVHYPADILGGAALGWFIGMGSARVSLRLASQTANINKL